MKPRFSLRMLMFLVAVVAAATFVSLNWREWRKEYRDWRAAHAIRERAKAVFYDEAKQGAPAELVHILGSGELTHWGWVRDVGLTGDHIISCGDDRTVRVWSAETGEALHVFNDVDGHVLFDSSLLVTIDDKRNVSVYDTASLPMKVLRKFPLASDSKVIWSFGSDVGSELAVAHEDERKSIVVYDVMSGERLCKMEFSVDLERFAYRYRYAFREDGSLLVVHDEEIRLMNARDGKEITRTRLERHARVPKGPTRDVTGVARLAAPWWLFASTESCWAWNEESHQWLSNRHFGDHRALAFPGTNQRAWVCGNGVMTLFYTPDETLHSHPVPTAPLRIVSALAFEPGAKYMCKRAIGYSDRTPMRDIGHVALLDDRGKQVLPASDVEHIREIAWSATGELLAVANTDGEVVVYSVGDWAEQARFDDHPAYMEFSDNDSLLLTVCQPNVVVRDWRSGATIFTQNIVVISGPAQRDATLSSGDGKVLSLVSNKHWVLSDFLANRQLAASDPVPIPARGWPEYWPVGPRWLESEGCYVYFARDQVCRLKEVEDPKTRTPKLEVTTNEYPEISMYTKPDDSGENKRVHAGRVLDFSPRDARVLLCHKYKEPEKLIVWDWSPEKVSVIPLDPIAAFRGAALLPGQAKVAALLGGDLVIFTAAGEEIYRQRIGPIQLREASLKFSPDGRYLAIVNGNGTCYLFKSARW